MSMECEICGFNNPKGSVTAVILRDNKLLLLKRNEEPFKGMWDLPGGYMNEGEKPQESMRKEIREELGVDCILDFIDWFPGMGLWKGKKYAVLNHAFLAELQGTVSLNIEENAEMQWVPLEQVDPTTVSFDSNQAIAAWAKEKFYIDIEVLKNLNYQLDSSAKIRETNFYHACLNGYVSKKIVDGKLVGLGWIFPRRTLLRKQAVIEDVVVDEKERGKGYGKDITLDLVRWAKENGVEVIELTSGSHRVAANELYKKVGFQLHPTNHYLYKVS